jgi:4-amino-4-deoxy-L-arabinose transferase-like glycosyltransferase
MGGLPTLASLRRCRRRDNLAALVYLPRVREGGAGARTEWLAWLAVLLAAAALLAATGYRSRDPDSALYAHIAARLATLPVAQWIAPEWWGGMHSEGPYREHPAGIFLVPALLGKLGYPAAQAAYAVNALYQVLTLALVWRVAVALVAPVEARALAWLLQLLPIAFTYRIRANHEQAILLCFLAALWGTERARTDARWIALTIAAMTGALLVKGVFVGLLLAACAAWLLTVQRPSRKATDGAAWAGLGGAAAVAVAVSAGYEFVYRQVTGGSFLAYYLPTQLGRAAVPRSPWLVTHKLYNLFWYLARVVWFPFPASLVAFAAGWSRRDALARVFHARSRADRTREGLAFTLGLSLLYLLLFSLSDRKADRYIFPAYYLIGACGLVAALRTWPRARRLVEAADRYHVVLPAALWLGLFALSLASGWLAWPRPKFWPAE